jgi:hypothetical protein
MQVGLKNSVLPEQVKAGHGHAFHHVGVQDLIEITIEAALSLVE